MVAGSDSLFTVLALFKQLLDNVRNTDLLGEDEKMGMFRTNALELLPRLA